MTADGKEQPSVDDARFEKILATTAGWIGAADAKANTVLTLCGTLLALAALAFAVAGSRPSLTSRVGLVVFVLFDVAGAFCALFNLWPRTDRRKLLHAAGSEEVKPLSLGFFTDLAGLTFSGFVELVEGATKTDLAKDSREQALILCKIARTKMHASRGAVLCVAVALVALAVAVVCAAMQS